MNAANLYAITCAAIGITLMAYTIYQRRKIRASEDWQAATGTITDAKVAVSQSSDGTTYSLAVSYEYVVNGSVYTGSRIEFGYARAYMTKKSAEAQLTRYPVQSSVVVYFNPEKPREAVLIRKATYTVLYFFLGLALLALGLIIVLYSPNWG